MTRRLVVTQNVSIDGVVENTGWFDPTEESERADKLAEITAEHAAASDAFLTGRVTFEEMRGFWPKRQDDQTGVTDHLNRVQKFVVSRTLQDPGWDGTTILRGDSGLRAEIEGLKEQEGRDIVLTGSIELARHLLIDGLVDELRLWIWPVFVGGGRRRLFPDDWTPRSLRTVEQRDVFGVVLLRYEVDH